MGMKKIITFFLVILSFNTYALGGYNSLSDVQKKTLKTIVNQLGISDKNNAVKTKIYEKIDFAFASGWDAYWLGLNELSGSKYKDGLEKGYIELTLNSVDEGTLFFTFVYKPEAKQIILTSKQVRYGSKKRLLEVYEERKADKDKFEVRHESDHYAMLQKKGKVNFEFFHVGSNAASLVYTSQQYIDL